MKNFHIHCATQCKIAAPTDKNCGNESKNHTTRGKKKKTFFFIQEPLYQEKNKCIHLILLMIFYFIVLK